MFDFQVPDARKIRVILDTDTANEADDPFAIVHAVLSPKLIVKGIVAEHFCKPDSMEKSLSAISTLKSLLHTDIPIYAGQKDPSDPVVSAGVQAIISEAMRDDPHPLFLLCLGALTNIARAFREAPQIESRVTVVTIGGHPYTDKAPFREFNFGNDPDAVNRVFASKAEIWQVPSSCYGAVRAGIAEIQEKVAPCGALGAYLFRQLADFNASPAAYWVSGESWVFGDSASVVLTLDPSCGRMHSVNARRILPDTSYGEAIEGKTIRVCQSMDVRYLLEDFYAKLRIFAQLENNRS